MLYLNVKRFSHLKQSQIHTIRRWYLFFAITFLILGVVSVLSPLEMSVLVVTISGAVLIFTGISLIIAHFSHRIKHWGSFFSSLALGILYAAIGTYFLIKPIDTAIILSLLIEVILLCIGIIRIAVTMMNPKTVSSNINIIIGIVEIILGITLIFMTTPNSIFAFAMLVGIEFLFESVCFFVLYKEIKAYLKEKF